MSGNSANALVPPGNDYHKLRLTIARTCLCVGIWAISGCNDGAPPETWGYPNDRPMPEWAESGHILSELDGEDLDVDVRRFEDLGLRVSPGPEFHWQIGSGAGVDDHPFTLISGAAFLSDSVIAVADGGTGEIHIFRPPASSSGAAELLHSFGGRGDGPGEFRGIDAIGLTAAGLSVVDYAARRITHLEWPSTHISTVRIEEIGRVSRGPGRPPVGRGLSPDGGTIVEIQERGLLGPVDEGKVIIDTIAYVRVTADGALADVLARIPHFALFAVPDGSRYYYGEAPFSVRPSFSAGGSVAAMGAGTEPSVWVVDLQSGHLTRIEWAETKAPVSTADVERMRSFGIPGGRALSDRFLRDAPFPEEFPSYMRVLVDQDERVWVMEYQRPWERADLGSRWRIFDVAQDTWFSVDLPRGFSPLAAGGEMVIGRATGALGEHSLAALVLNVPW
jgi:hypothetical protein